RFFFYLTPILSPFYSQKVKLVGWISHHPKGISRN
ncbi:MAG: hypothetical protein ACI85I_000472, partial [Arenicella sp.]